MRSEQNKACTLPWPWCKHARPEGGSRGGGRRPELCIDDRSDIKRIARSDRGTRPADGMKNKTTSRIRAAAGGHTRHSNKSTGIHWVKKLRHIYPTSFCAAPRAPAGNRRRRSADDASIRLHVIGLPVIGLHAITAHARACCPQLAALDRHVADTPPALFGALQPESALLTRRTAKLKHESALRCVARGGARARVWRGVECQLCVFRSTHPCGPCMRVGGRRGIERA